MSLNELANEAVAMQTSLKRPEGELAASGTEPVDSKLSNALGVLVRYIPTEIVTIYVAALGTKVFIPHLVYISGAAATPTVLLLLIIGKTPVAERGKVTWPTVWKMIAATIAFLVWALAVPDSPLPPSQSARILAAFGAVLVSMLLTLLEPVVAPEPAKP